MGCRRRRTFRTLAGQVLINPVLDLSHESPSYERLGEGCGLRAADMRSYKGWYVADGDDGDSYLSPLRADSLAGVAPAVVVTAGFDPLHDEGVAYVKRLANDDVTVISIPMPRMLHGWWSLPPVSPESVRQSKRVLDAIHLLRSLG